MGLDETGHLAAGVGDLDQRVRPCGLSPSLQRRAVRLRVDHDVAGALEVSAVDHRVAGEDQSGPAAGVGRVEAEVPFGRIVATVGKALGHRGAPKPVRQLQATGKGEGVGKRGHGGSAAKG